MRKNFLLLLLLLLVCSCGMAQSFYLFVGTYTNTNAGSKGIYVYRFNASTGKADSVFTTQGIVNPSYLAIAPGGRYVYAVTETGGNTPGNVSAFAFDRTTNQLTFINKQPSGGDNPCYVSVSKNIKWLLVANYSSGNLSALPVNGDGSIQPLRQNIQHTGKSVNPQRQEHAHAHSAVLSPAQDYLFSADLGEDKLYCYEFNPAAEKPLQPASPPFTVTEPGSGPRHFTFHPTKPYAYLIEEMGGSVNAYRYNKGKLMLMQHIITHPADFKGALGSADIHISPDGKFLYASNRGEENTLTIFSIDASGKLALKGYQPVLGATPRNFVIDPTGNYLLVANQSSNNIVIFKRDKQTGLLHETGDQLKVPTPVCLQFTP